MSSSSAPARTVCTAAAPAVGALSALYAVLGTWWTLGGPGYPFGEANDPGATVNALGGVAQSVGAPGIALFSLIGLVAAAAMTLRRGRGFGRLVVSGWGWAAAVALLFVVPDYRVLAAVAYAPLYLVGAPFGWPPGSSFFDAITWPLVNQAVAIAGGLVWAAAVLEYRRATDDRGGSGRQGLEARWTAPDAARRWGVGLPPSPWPHPLVYAATRWAWALGIPLGISEELLRYGQERGLWVAGAGLASVAAVGALLTLGLVLPFGETFPRWLPRVSGRDVPPALAVIPSLVVAVLVTSAGLMFVRLAVTGAFEDGFGFIGPPGESWAAIAPELLWPIWGVALGLASIAYHYRRRGQARARPNLATLPQRRQDPGALPGWTDPGNQP